METLIKIFSNAGELAGSFLVVWGIVMLAYGMKDSDGSTVARAGWLIGGGAAIAAFSAAAPGLSMGWVPSSSIGTTGNLSDLLTKINIDTSGISGSWMVHLLTKLLAVIIGIVIQTMNLLFLIAGNLFGSGSKYSIGQIASSMGAYGILITVGSAFFAFFTLSELVSEANSRSFSGGELSAIEVPTALIIKVAVVASLALNKNFIKALLNSMSDLALYFAVQAQKISAVSSNGGSSINYSSILSDFANSMAKLHFLVQILTFLVLLIGIVFAGFALAKVMGMAIAVGVKFLAFIVVAPIALASFVSNEYKQMGISWMKHFIAVSLELGFIMIGVYIGALIGVQLISAAAQLHNAQQMGGFITAVMVLVAVLTYSFALIGAAEAGSEISRSIFG